MWVWVCADERRREKKLRQREKTRDAEGENEEGKIGGGMEMRGDGVWWSFLVVKWRCEVMGQIR